MPLSGGKMQLSFEVNGPGPVALRVGMGWRFVWRRRVWALSPVLVALLLAGPAAAQGGPLVLERDGRRVISLVPYAPNIVRITMSTDRGVATGAPGYGIIAQPSAKGWTHERDAEGDDVYRSTRMVVRVAPGDLPPDKLPQPMPLDALNRQLREQFFPGGGGRQTTHNDALLVTAADGTMLLHMRTWTMAPESAEAEESDTIDKGFSRVAAMFDSPADEHYYGLGQQQKRWMDLRDHEIRCWHDYVAIGGEDVCVPFMVSTRGYGLVWDNPSKTTIDLGFNGRNVWSSEAGNRVSYFVIAGQTSDEIYEGYRLLTGITHMLPRAVYGYIQSKAIYPTQQQILDVAKEYRERKLPLDVIVVDFLNMTRQGEMDLDPRGCY
jgi:alpha-D-xyloside xylohydrolase